MSTDWEVVESRRRQKAKPEPPKKSIVENGVGKPPRPKENAKKNKEKKNDCDGAEKTKRETTERKRAKNLEKAISTIDLAELRNVCGATSLADVAGYLDSKLIFDGNDETRSEAPLDYPFSVVPSEIKREIDGTIAKESKNGSVRRCIEFCLSSIAHNMTRGRRVPGYELMIRCIAEYDPTLFSKCVEKVSNLMRSYENQPPIGIALLRSIGRGGLKNFNVGVEVWRKTMLPLIEKKNYSKFVVEYLTALLSDADDSTVIGPTEFWELFCCLHSERPSLPKHFDKQIREQSVILRKLYFQRTNSWRSFDFMDKLLAALPNAYDRNLSCDFKSKEILGCVVDALTVNESNYERLKNLLAKYPKQTSHVLYAIERDWKATSSKLNRAELAKVLRQCARAFAHAGPEAESAIECCQALLALALPATMAKERERERGRERSGRGFPWASASLVLLVAILAALVYHDVSTARTFSKSRTAQLLETGRSYSSKGLAICARGFKYVERESPPLFASLSASCAPYYALARDFALILANQAREAYALAAEFFAVQWPRACSTVDGYAPGLLPAVRRLATTASGVARGYYDAARDYLETKVFVDEWAPDALLEKTLRIVDSTKTYAAECYERFYKHVDDYSKLE